MFEIGWTEMLVIAIVMIVVVGPKDLPKMLRTFGRTTAKLRTMAGDFQRQFNEALKEAELDDVKKSVDELRSLNPANEIKKQLNPFEKAAADVRAGLETLKPPARPLDPTPAEPASTEAAAGEPLKNGATVMPDSGPTTMPEPPRLTPAEPIVAKTAEPAAAAKAAANGAHAAAVSVAGLSSAPAQGAGKATEKAAGEPPKTKKATKAPAAKATAASNKPAAKKPAGKTP